MSELKRAGTPGVLNAHETRAAGSIHRPTTRHVARANGFCFDCDKPLLIECELGLWAELDRPLKCLSCGGSRVAFMGAVADHLWQRLQDTKRRYKALCETYGLRGFPD